MGIEAAILGSAVVGAAGARSAGRSQANAANAATSVQREMFEQTREDLQPFAGSGVNALRALEYEMGIGERPTFGAQPLEVQTLTRQAENPNFIPRQDTGGGQDGVNPFAGQTPRFTNETFYRVGDRDFTNLDEANAFAAQNATGGTPYQGFTATPGYDFRLQQGIDAIDASAASRGGLFSGATMENALRFGQDYATSEYTNYLNRLQGIAGAGQSAAAGQGAAGMQFGQQAGQNALAAGNARSAATIGMTNALSSGVDNYLGYNMMNRYLDRIPVAGG